MNVQIKQLAEQAGLKVESWMTNPPNPFQILGSTEQFEEFVELVIKECIESIAEIADQNAEDHVVRIALAEAVLNIEDHFGVTE